MSATFPDSENGATESVAESSQESAKTENDYDYENLRFITINARTLGIHSYETM